MTTINLILRKCSECGHNKQAHEFSVVSKRSDGLSATCKACTAKFRPSRHRGVFFDRICVKCNKPFITDRPQKMSCSKECAIQALIKSNSYKEKKFDYRLSNKSKIAEYQKKYRQSVRAELFRLYGDKCKCCGEACKTFLTLDHINNYGAKRRSGSRSNEKEILFSTRNYRPDLFQVLCMNCNFGKKILGYCPHGY